MKFIQNKGYLLILSCCSLVSDYDKVIICPGGVKQKRKVTPQLFLIKNISTYCNMKWLESGNLLLVHKPPVLVFSWRGEKLEQKPGFTGSNCFIFTGNWIDTWSLVQAHLLPDWARLPACSTDVSSSIDVRKWCVHLVIHFQATIFS